MTNITYNRKISSKEARKGFIFILKNKLTLFPAVGSEFTLTENNSSKDVKVDHIPVSAGVRINRMNITSSGGKD